MDERIATLARLDGFQVAWQHMLEAAAKTAVPDCPRTSEDRLKADIKNEALWLLESLRQYRSIPVEERY